MTKTNPTKKVKSGIEVKAKIPEEQYKVIEKLEGVLGVTKNGVVAHIINSWLTQQDWFNDIVKEKVKK